MFNDEYNEPWEVDSETLALGRWSALLRAVKAALTHGPVRRNLELCVVIEHELGLRPLVTSANQTPRLPEEIIKLLKEYDDEHSHLICRFVPALERALACYPYWWLSYVESVGRANFDPVELGVCAGIARVYAQEPKEHQEITAIIHHCWMMLLGQWPVLEIRALPRQGDPTLLARVIKATEQVQLNWRGLGMRPVVTDDLAVRWIDRETWVAWVRLSHFRTGRISDRSVLRLQSDGLFRLLRRPL